MKSSNWILMISTLALFSAHQTHRSDADKPDYARNPAMIRPAYDLQANLKTAQAKAVSHKTQRAKEKLRKPHSSI
jgi:hypothetical protein